MVEQLLQTCAHDPADMWTLKKRIIKEEDVFCSNIAKVVCDIDGFALYFSRSTIPHYRDKDSSFEKQEYYKHIGIYAYRAETLEQLVKLPVSPLEQAETLEQLRWLENGYKIQTEITDYESISIDTPEDIKKTDIFF